MHEVYFSTISFTDNKLELNGDYFKGIVRLVNNRNWRIFIWHRLEDENKNTWTIENCEHSHFQYEDCGEYVKLYGGNATELKIYKNLFSWEWENVKAKKLDANNMRSSSKMEELATGEGNPYIETNDGLPMGAGYTLSIEESVDRNYYALGERTGFLNKKGRLWQNWNTDISRHVPNTDPLYQAHPFVIGGEKGHFFGLYLDETWKTDYDLGYSQADKSYISTAGPTFDLYLIPGPSPKKLLENYTHLIGRSYMPPLWALGFHQCRWSYPDQKCIQSVAKEYRKRDIPLEAMWLDIDYMDGYKVFTFSPYRFPQPEALTKELKEINVRTVVIVDPGVKKEKDYEVYESGHRKKMFVNNRRDEEFVGEVWPAPAVWPDFTREEVRTWWGEWLQIYEKAGVDGIWNDMNEPAAFKLPGKTIPPGTKHGERWHAEVHNVYGHMMGKATYDALKKISPEKRPFILTRSGFAGIQKYAFVWTGDNSSFWEHLEMSIPMILNMGLSGIPFSGADIGGFSGDCDGELLARWTWLGAFYPFMRNHSGKGSRRQEPWCFGEPYLKIVREAIRFRYKILPYLYTLSHEAMETGLPIMRPLFLDFPTDENTYTLNDQFLYGNGLLVAPITRPGQNNRMVYLPAGKWQDIFSGEIYEGTKHVVIPSPLTHIPILQKTDIAIPFTEAQLHTKDAQWNDLTWRVVLHENTSGKVYQDKGDGYEKGTFRELETRYDGNKLYIKQTGNNAKQKCKIEIINAPEPKTMDNNMTFSYRENILTIDMENGEGNISWS